MEETTANGSPVNSTLRQPKKRFVGRRTADAQAQKEQSSSQNDVESTSIQKGWPYSLLDYAYPETSADNLHKLLPGEHLEP